MAITKTRAQLFSGTYNGQHIQIFVDPLSRIRGLIGNTPALVRGLPQTVSSLSSALYFLGEHCRVTTNFGTILVLVRLRGGMPQSSRTPALRPLDANCIPPIERACATVGGALEKLGFGLTLIGAVGGTVYPPLKILEVAGMICVFGGAGLSVRKYQLEHTRIAGQAYSNLQEIQAIECFIKKKLPDDLQEIGDGIEKAIFDCFKNEFGDLQSQRIQPQQIQAMRNFFGAASYLYSYKNKSGAEQLMLCGTSLCDALEAGFKLKTPFSLFEQIEPVSAIVKAGAAIGFSLHSYFNPPEDATQKLIDLFRADLRQLSREVQSGVRSLAVLLKAGLADLMQEITATRASLTTLTNLSQREFSGIQANQRNILAAIDIKNMTDVQFKLSWMILKIKNSSVGTFDQKEYGDFILELLTWAKDGSKMDEVTCSNKTDVVTVLKRSAPFCIGFLAVHLRTNPSLANPLVWAEATDAYIELRLRNPGNYDAQILSDTVHTDLLGIMRQVGETAQAWIQRIQADKTLFSNLVKDHLQVIQDLQSEWSKAITAKATTLSPQLKTLLSKFEETYYLLRRFTEIAFSRSHKSDFFFMSLFSDQHPWAHRLVTRDELEGRLISALSSQDALEEFWENLTETLGLLGLSIEQKIDSHQTGGNTEDQNYLLSVTLYKFDLFLHERYPSKFSAPVPHKVKSAHLTDINQLCKDKMFLAAKIGAIKAVMACLNAGEDVNQRHPTTGRTILHEAARGQHEGLVGELLKIKNIDIDAKDHQRKTPFDEARGNIKSIIRQALEKQSPIRLLGNGKELKEVFPVQVSNVGFLEGGFFYKDLCCFYKFNTLYILDLNTGEIRKTFPILESHSGPSRRNEHIAFVEHIVVFSDRKKTYILDLRDASLTPLTISEPLCLGNNDSFIGKGSVSRIYVAHGIVILSGHDYKWREKLVIDLCSGNILMRFSHPIAWISPLPGSTSKNVLLEGVSCDFKMKQISFLKSNGTKVELEKTLPLPIKGMWKSSNLNDNLLTLTYQQHTDVIDLRSGKIIFTANMQSGTYQTGGLTWQFSSATYGNILIAPYCPSSSRSRFQHGVWDISSGELLCIIDNVNRMVVRTIDNVYPNLLKHNKILKWVQKGCFELYDFVEKKSIGQFKFPSNHLISSQLFGNILIMTYGNNPYAVAFWDINSGKLLQTIKDSNGILVDGDNIVSIGSDTKVWKISDVS